MCDNQGGNNMFIEKERLMWAATQCWYYVALLNIYVYKKLHEQEILTKFISFNVNIKRSNAKTC